MMGAPGAGKTTVRQSHPRCVGLTAIDVDAFRADTREECVALAATAQAAYLAAGHDLVIDSTGRFPEKWIALAQEQRARGYEVGVIMVHARLTTCLKRAAERERRFPVPAWLVTDAWTTTRAGFADVASACNWGEWVNNDDP